MRQRERENGESEKDDHLMAAGDGGICTMHPLFCSCRPLAIWLIMVVNLICSINDRNVVRGVGGRISYKTNRSARCQHARAWRMPSKKRWWRRRRKRRGANGEWWSKIYRVLSGWMCLWDNVCMFESALMHGVNCQLMDFLWENARWLEMFANLD